MGFKDWYHDSTYKVDGKKSSYWKNWRDWYEDDNTYYDPAYSGLGSGIVELEPDSRDSRDTNRKICEDALKSIARSANVILNSGNETERRLSIKFSDGENKNTLDQDSIYLSPDKLVSAKGRDDREEVIDSLCGQSMLSAQLKRQLDAKVYGKFLEEKDNEVKSLWSSIELAIARGEIISDWSGFKPYFDSYAAYSSKTTSTVVKRELGKYSGVGPEKPTNSKAFITGIAWNLYHSHDPVKIPAAYNAGKTLIASGLVDADSCEKRWEFCRNVVDELRKMYDKVPPPPPPAPKSPFEEGESDSPSNVSDLLAHVERLNKKAEGGKKEAEPKKGISRFTGVDEELFGSKAVENKKCKSAAEISEVTGDSSSEAKDSISAPSVPSRVGRKVTLDRAIPFWVEKDKPTRYSEHHFDAKMTNQLDRLAEAIKDSFGFTNNELKRRAFSQRTGTIHPESMYKINMDRDDVFYKKTYTETDKVSVCLLIDQSGSMGCIGSHGRADPVSKVVEAAEVAYVIAKMCKDLKNLDLSVVGFSAQEGCLEACKTLSRSDGSMDREMNMRLIYDSLDPKHNDIKSICHIRHHSNNLDGFSIWHAAKRMANTRPESKRKILIVVSDGQPHGSGYGGEEAMSHVNLCMKDSRRRFGVETYSIGISNAYSKEDGIKMYGAQNNIVISDIKSSVGFISRFLNQVSQSV